LIEIPAEIRLSIYQYLAPEKTIPTLESYDETLLGLNARERAIGIFAFKEDSTTDGIEHGDAFIHVEQAG
jgi:hypothetical protein